MAKRQRPTMPNSLCMTVEPMLPKNLDLAFCTEVSQPKPLIVAPVLPRREDDPCRHRSGGLEGCKRTAATMLGSSAAGTQQPLPALRSTGRKALPLVNRDGSRPKSFSLRALPGLAERN